MRAYSMSQGRIIDVPDDTPVLNQSKVSMGGATTGVSGNLTPYQSYQIGQDKTEEEKKRIEEEEKKKIIKDTASRIISGQITPDDITKEAFQALIPYLPPDFKVPDKVSEADKKNIKTKSAIESLVNEMEKSYLGAGGGSVKSGPLAGIVGFAEGAKGNLGLNDDARVYNKSKRGFATTLKTLAGESGQSTDQDFERLAGLLPELGDTSGVAGKQFQILRDQIAAKYGGESGKTQFSRDNAKSSLDIIKGATIDPIVNFTRDAGEGISDRLADPGIKNILDKEEAIASSLERKAMEESDPKKKAKILKQATSVRLGMSEISGQRSEAFSPDIQKDYLERGVDTSSAITTLAGIAGLGKSGLGLVKNGPKIPDATGKLDALFKAKKSLSPFSKLGAARQKAIEEIGEISTDSLRTAAKEYVKADPTAKSVYKKVVTEIPKKLTGPELYKKIDIWNNAYTAAKTVGKSPKAGLYDVLAKAAKSEIVSRAPKVKTYNELFSLLYGTSDILKKTVPAVVAGGTAAYFLNKGLDKATGSRR